MHVPKGRELFESLKAMQRTFDSYSGDRGRGLSKCQLFNGRGVLKRTEKYNSGVMLKRCKVLKTQVLRSDSPLLRERVIALQDMSNSDKNIPTESDKRERARKKQIESRSFRFSLSLLGGLTARG